ncbi:MAG: host attachment protein [Pseudomonadota bacterium]|nr:host attachment protein [Pseudomonadota bacterium]
MKKPTIPHDAIIFVGDGRRALFVRNHGDEKFPNLRAERVFADDNPATHEQGTDRPGRSTMSADSSRHSAMEATDWHDIEEHRFVKRVSEALEGLVRERGAAALVIAAPPRALADLRHALHQDVKARIVLEINKDLTKMPLWEIEKHIFA